MASNRYKFLDALCIMKKVMDSNDSRFV